MRVLTIGRREIAIETIVTHDSLNCFKSMMVCVTKHTYIALTFEIVLTEYCSYFNMQFTSLCHIFINIISVISYHTLRKNKKIIIFYHTVSFTEEKRDVISDSYLHLQIYLNHTTLKTLFYRNIIIKIYLIYYLYI